jgi:hypothetical protein
MFYIVMSLWISARYWRDVRRISSVRPADQASFEELLAHAAHAVRHLANPLAGLPVQLPPESALLPQTAALGLTLPFVPVTLAFRAPMAYLVCLTVAFAASASTAYWALSRHLLRSRVAAFAGASVYAFAPGLLWHANGQPAFVATFLVPLLVVGVVRLGQGRRVRRGLVLGALAAWQFLINPEVLVITALAGGLAALAYRLLRGKEAAPETGSGRNRLVGLGVAAGTAVVLLGYPLWYVLAGDPVVHAVARPDPRLGEDVTTLALFWQDSLAGSFTAARSIGSIEQNSWFGWPLLILAGICVYLYWQRSVAVRVVTVTALVFGALSFGAVLRANGHPTVIPGPWWLVGRIPGFDLIAPTHLALVLVSCLAVLIATACDRLPEQDPVSYGLTFRRVWILLVAVALVPLVPRPIQAIGVNGNAPDFIKLGTWRSYVSTGQTLVPVPSTPSGVDGMVFRAAALDEFELAEPYRGAPTGDGAGLTPVGSSPTANLLRTVAAGRPPVITPEAREQALAEIRSWHAAVFVLAGGGKLVTRMRDTVTDLLTLEPIELGGAWVWDVRDMTKVG